MQIGHFFLPVGYGFGLYKFVGSRKIAGYAKLGPGIGGIQNFLQQRVIAKWCLNKYLRLVKLLALGL